MAVKPYDFIARGKRRLLQSAVKVRGKEYLRIIYGPEYTAKRNMDRLRGRNLGRKRSLALRQFALGVEYLERIVRKEPLRYVHECVFGVLALESGPVDPRLKIHFAFHVIRHTNDAMTPTLYSYPFLKLDDSIQLRSP